MKILLFIVILTLCGNFTNYHKQQTEGCFGGSIDTALSSGISAREITDGDEELLSGYTLSGLPSGSVQYIQADYLKLKQQILLKRDSFHSSYSISDSSKRNSIINSARDYIFETVTHDIFSYWYGTPWNFYGCTNNPGEGSIACGYFVMRVLDAAAFNVPITWGDLASEVFIKKLTKDIKRYHRNPIDNVKNYVEKRMDGLYIVGLDCHVGFIYKKGDDIKFVHSNYYHPEIGVMAEEFETENPLNDSKYRVLGRILDDEMVVKWINNWNFK